MLKTKEEITNNVVTSETSALHCAKELVILAKEAKCKARNIVVSFAPPNGKSVLNETLYLAHERIFALLKNKPVLNAADMTTWEIKVSQVIGYFQMIGLI